MYHEFITKMYKKVTGKNPPENMLEKEMAKAIIEVFGNREILTTGNEQLCEVAFRHHVEFNNAEEKKQFLLIMEDNLGLAKTVK